MFLTTFGKSVSVSVLRQKRKSIMIRVQANRIVVCAPTRVGTDTIAAALEGRRGWVEGQLARQAADADVTAPLNAFRQILAGGVFYPIERLAAEGFSPDKTGVLQFYRRGFASLADKLTLLADRHGFVFSGRVRWSDAKTHWGSCNRAGRIALNFRVLMLPPELADYILLHELVHTVHLHHQKPFWEALGALMPDYRARKKALRDRRYLMDVYR
ncbi:MAG: M48 family metallopeptidase [Clostridiales bacterium]|jgi:predicted metal-dependent hydrolase|nr:M48 family metallopeptidase [Clostridiales bacterium]